jgi:hypothetical protein
MLELVRKDIKGVFGIFETLHSSVLKHFNTMHHQYLHFSEG